MNNQSEISKRLWPGGFPGTTTTTPSFQQFPNGVQLNQIWMESLAKGMTQMEGSYNIATSTNPATALTVPAPRPLAHSPRNGVVLPSRSLPSGMPEAPTSRNQNQMQQGGKTTQILLNDADKGAAERERKRKNREFAKRSREKRRNEQTLLEDEVAGLQQINSRLRQIVQEKIPTHAQSILKKCCADHPLHHAANASGNRKEDMLANSDFHLVENLIKQQQSFCLTDPALPDNPIVYASANFYKLTGFTKEASLGRNCRFLQGKDTGMKSVALIRDSIKDGKDISVNLLNYKADATPFWNQFFIAALRNRTGKIVNYVGVQCEIEEPNDEKPIPNGSPSSTNAADIGTLSRKPKCIRIKGPFDVGGLHGKPDRSIPEVPANKESHRSSVPSFGQNDFIDQTLQPLDISDPVKLADENKVDWSILAGVLEDDFRDKLTGRNSLADFDMAESSIGDGETVDSNDFQEQPQLEYHTLTPRAFVTKTCRSELVDALLSAHGDVTDPRFLKALDILSSIYASSDPDKPSTEACIDNFLLNGAWVSLSRPAYTGCLGKNARGDYMYSLGKMSFNMFKPGHLKCSIQHTLNKVGFVCDMNEALTAVPWSLRREFAMAETDDVDDRVKPSNILRSYDIEVAVTIEPSEDNSGNASDEEASPKKPLRAVQVVNGYLLRDPHEKNRLSVWFTGGKLAPYSPPDSAESLDDDTKYGDFEEWKAIFDREYKTSWSESFKNMGAVLFLGAELPQGMNPDGSMGYSLTRPYGGHGKSYIDVLYVDEGLFVTRGNYGTIHVGIRSNLLCPALPDISNSKDPTFVDPINEVEATSESSNKRKVADGMNVRVENNADHSMMWRDALTSDLETRPPAFVSQDLNEILLNYGLQVQSITKRLKPNGF